MIFSNPVKNLALPVECKVGDDTTHEEMEYKHHATRQYQYTT